MSAITLLSPVTTIVRLELRSVSREFLTNLARLREECTPEEWTDAKSVEAFKWIARSLSYRPSPLESEEEVMAHVQESLQELSAIIANPMDNTPLQDPVLENNTHVWERAMLDDYMVCYQATIPGVVTSAYSEPRDPKPITSVKEHTLIKRLMALAGALPYGAVFYREGSDDPIARRLEAMSEALVPLRRTPLEQRSQEALRAQFVHYRNLALFVLTQQGFIDEENRWLEMTVRNTDGLAQLEERIARDNAAFREALAAHHLQTTEHIARVAESYDAASATQRAHLDDQRRRLDEEAIRIAGLRTNLNSAFNDIADLRRANADLQWRLANIDTSSGCSIM